MTEGDNESALERLSELPGTLIIGNDPDEWWHGDDARTLYARQREELGPFPLAKFEVEAWEEGTVGWACVKHGSPLRPGASTAVRPTSCTWNWANGKWCMCTGQ